MSTEITPSDIRRARKVARIAWFAFKPKTTLTLEDCEGIAMIALCESASRWRPDGGASLSTLSYTRIRGAILDEHSKLPGCGRSPGHHRRRVLEVPIDDTLDVGVGGHQEEITDLSRALDRLGRIKGKRAKFLRLRLEGETLEAAGAAIGISKSWACRMEASIFAKFREAA